MNKLLSAEERTDLRNKHRKERNGKVRERVKAVLAYDEDYTYSEIAGILLLDDETVRRHVGAYLSKKQLHSDYSGRASNLTTSQTERLIAHLEEKMYLYVKEICEYVEQAFAVSYSLSGMTK